jgi:heme-degrading monooxygenase HmoA
MKYQDYHLAEVNIARMAAPLESPLLADFVARLDEINSLADESPGFIWRLQSDEGNATYFKPYDDDLILFNLSVWESPEDLKNYVYRSAHNEVFKRRREWFEKFNGMFFAMWWVKSGELPTIAEAKQRLDYLEKNGPTEFAFTFKQTFEPTDREFEISTPSIGTQCQAS